jgi:hypothetical protein
VVKKSYAVLKQLFVRYEINIFFILFYQIDFSREKRNFLSVAKIDDLSIVCFEDNLVLEMISILAVAGGVQIRSQVKLVVNIRYPNSLHEYKQFP